MAPREVFPLLPYPLSRPRRRMRPLAPYDIGWALLLPPSLDSATVCSVCFLQEGQCMRRVLVSFMGTWVRLSSSWSGGRPHRQGGQRFPPPRRARRPPGLSRQTWGGLPEAAPVSSDFRFLTLSVAPGASRTGCGVGGRREGCGGCLPDSGRGARGGGCTGGAPP